MKPSHLLKAPAVLGAAMVLLALTVQAPAQAPAAEAPTADKPAATTAPVTLTEPLPGEGVALPELKTVLDKQVVNALSRMPVQVNGRVKPLDTLARFTLLAMYGKQEIKAEHFDKEAGKMMPLLDPKTNQPVVNAKGKSKLSAMDWLALTWFRPDLASKLPVFVVDNSDAVALLQIEARGKRDRYSFEEINAGREKLNEKMESLRGMRTDAMSPEQRSIAKLGRDFLDYEMMLRHFDFARAPFRNAASKVPKEILPSAEGTLPPPSEWLPKVADYFKTHRDEAPMAHAWFANLYRSALSGFMDHVAEERLSIFPPEDKELKVWKSPGNVIIETLGGAEPSVAELKMLTDYGLLADAKAGPGEMAQRAETLVTELTAAAKERNEVGKIALEVFYHRMEFFYHALLLFILGTMALAASWAAPGSLWATVSRVICWVFMIAGAALGVVGIVIRCILMMRPPITTLYETIIFISTAGVIVALIVEALVKRKGLAMTIGCIAGVAGLLLSIRFHDMEAKDSLQQLQAVLITNFWLATHVPAINLGYALGMLACICSMVYFSRRALGVTKMGDEDARTMSRISYALVLTGLFFSLVGTVLGGVWANYSWGRFWGWDPKENGALMIVLMNLIILHARLGGYIREAGFHVCCIVLGMITIFSWFATNQLGIGLHAYGELSGAWKKLYTTWGVLAAFVVMGIIYARIDRNSRSGGGGGITGASAREDQKQGRALHPQAAAKS